MKFEFDIQLTPLDGKNKKLCDTLECAIRYEEARIKEAVKKEVNLIIDEMREQSQINIKKFGKRSAAD